MGSEMCIRDSSLSVGLSWVGIVSLDFKEVLLEDEPSVCFFFRSPVDSVLSFPVFEGISLLSMIVVEGEESDGGQCGEDKLLSH